MSEEIPEWMKQPEVDIEIRTDGTANERSELAPAQCSASGVEAEVCADIAARQRRGIEKYRTTVAANPLSLEQWLQHAYEECLDQAIYLKKAIAVTKTQNAPGERPGQGA